MRKLILLITIITSAHSFAAPVVVEFDEAKEVQCHSEIKAMKCTNKAGEEVTDCVESKKAKLSQDCRSMHTSKMNNK